MGQKGAQTLKNPNRNDYALYVNDSPFGALAEFYAKNLKGPKPVILRVEYVRGLNYRLATPTHYIKGAIPVAADTLTTRSLQLPWTFNTLVRNGTARPSLWWP
jgi:hypothetical protein